MDVSLSPRLLVVVTEVVLSLPVSPFLLVTALISLSTASDSITCTDSASDLWSLGICHVSMCAFFKQCPRKSKGDPVGFCRA